MNIIFSTIVGSKLYGINNDKSDTDVKAIGMPDLSKLVGLACSSNESNMVEMTNGKQGPDKVETVIYSLRKFVNLCMSGNPTVLELAFAENVPDCILNNTDLGREVNKYVRDNLVGSQIFPAYRGYFKQQVILIERGMRPESSRNEDIEKFGYDVKAAAHAVRLALQGIQLIKDREGYSPRLKGDELGLVSQIRKGTPTKDEISEILKRMDKELENTFTNKCTLGGNPDYEKVNEWFTNIVKNWIVEDMINIY